MYKRQALLGELRDPRWTLVVAPTGTTGDDAGLDDLAARYRPVVSVRELRHHAGGGERTLADPSGALHRDLDLGSGGWLLIRPDGYLAATGRGALVAEIEAALHELHLLEVHPQASTEEASGAFDHRGSDRPAGPRHR